MCAMSLSTVVGRAAMPYFAGSSQQGAVRSTDTHAEVHMYYCILAECEAHGESSFWSGQRTVRGGRDGTDGAGR